MNIIFVDFDGVFNNDASFILHDSLIHNDCMEFFLDAIDELKKEDIEIKLVISSTWRKGRDFEDFSLKIIEQTPKFFQRFLNLVHEDWRTGSDINGFRGNEVKAWLDKHPEVKTFVCLDDDSDFLEDQPLIQTITELGFGWAEKNLLVDFFLKKNNKTIDTHNSFEQKFFIKKLENQLKFIEKHIKNKIFIYL